MSAPADPFDVSDLDRTLPTCDLNTKFEGYCSTDWSDRNLISIVSRRGIYIVRLQKDTKYGPFIIELIQNPETKFQHKTSQNLWIPFDQLWSTLNSRQYNAVFMDPALLTNVEARSLETYPRYYRLAKWSPPLDRPSPDDCLLAAITLDYQLTIFTRRNDVWITQTDLSHEYDSSWNHWHPNIKEVAKSFDKIREYIHSLSFCNLCWKQTSDKRTLLLAITIPGDIVIWEMTIDDSTKSEDTKLSFDIKTVLQTNLSFINSAQFFDNLLIVAARDGRVVLYDLTTHFENLTQTKKGLRNKNTSTLPIQATATLWDQDDIHVPDICIHTISESTFRVVLTKATNICWCSIQYTKKTHKDPATLTTDNSFSAIDGLDPDVNMHHVEAMSMKAAGNDGVILIAEDGSFFRLVFVSDNQDVSPEISPVRTGRDLSRLIPKGICVSPKGDMMLLVSCLSVVYDPSKVLAPTKLMLLPTGLNKN